MKRLVASLLLALAVVAAAPPARAAHVRVVHRPNRAVVRVGVGFPVRRPLPHVVVRTPVVAVRVAPRAYLPRVAFTAAVVAAPVAAAVAWHNAETLARNEEWTDFTFNIDRRGTGLLLDIGRGPAQVSFAEVVFENGETQVVDFDDREHKIGVYSLLDFKNGRKVDHVRVVAKANADGTTVGVHLLT
jgi:hypothetical protein